MQKVKRKQIDFGGSAQQYVRGDGSLGNINTISGSNFVFTLTEADDISISCDKTIEEIISALENNETVIAKYSIADASLFLYTANIEVLEQTVVVKFDVAVLGIIGVAIIIGHYDDVEEVWTIDSSFTLLSSEQYQKLQNIEAGAQVNVQPDWEQDDDTADDFIKNKPTIPSVSSKADKVSGATNGNFAALDSNGNLTDSGNKASDFLTSHQSLADYYTKSQIDALIAAVYKPQGSVSSISSLGSLDASHLGYVYNMSASFTTTSDFVEGANKTYPAGTNIVIVDVGTSPSHSYKYDVLSGLVDLTNYVLSSALSAVAFSGDYDDLLNKPTMLQSNVMIVTMTASTFSAASLVFSGTPSESFSDVCDFISDGGSVIVIVTDSYDSKKYVFTLEGAAITNSALTSSIRFVCTHYSGSTFYLKYFDWYSSTILAYAKSFANVAFSGNYSDLSNTPTIPSAANTGKLKIKKDTDTAVEVFNANESTDKTINIVAGSNVSLTEDTTTANVYKLIIALTGLASVATSGSYGDLSNKPIFIVELTQSSAYDPDYPNNNNVFSNPSHTYSEIVAAITAGQLVFLHLKNAGIGRGRVNVVIPLSVYMANTAVGFLLHDVSANNVDQYEIWCDVQDSWFLNFYRKNTVTGVNDGTNWTSLTIGSVTKSIPSGGGGGGTSLPSYTNNGGKVLKVNSNEDGIEWSDLPKIPIPTAGSGGQILVVDPISESQYSLATLPNAVDNHNFTALTYISHSNASTVESITFVTKQRNTIWIDTSVDLHIAITCNNDSDNYILVNNTSSSDIDVVIDSINTNAAYSVIGGAIEVAAGSKRELGVLKYTKVVTENNTPVDTPHYIITHTEI